MSTPREWRSREKLEAEIERLRTALEEIAAAADLEGRTPGTEAELACAALIADQGKGEQPKAEELLRAHWLGMGLDPDEMATLEKLGESERERWLERGRAALGGSE